MKYSSNKKLNAALAGIEQQIIECLGSGDRTAALAEAARYKEEFPREADYNIAQYGNLIVYYSDLYKFYRECGYKSTDRMSADNLWATYLRQVGYVTRELLRAETGGRTGAAEQKIFEQTV